MLLGARSDPGAVHRAREGREFRVLGSKMRRPADSEFPGGNRDREAGNPLRYIDTGFQYKLPADFEFSNSRIRTYQNQSECLNSRCPNQTGAAIMKMKSSSLAEFPEAADPPDDCTYSIRNPV